MTLYTTTDGPVSTPVDVEVWTALGERLGYLGDYIDMAFTWADRAPDTATLVLPLNALTATLTSVDGTVLIGARTGTKTHLSTPVEVSVEGAEDGTAQVHVSTAGGWSLFAGARIPPSLEDPLEEQTGEGYVLRGSLDSVVKRIVRLAADRLDLPVLVAPSNNSGPDVDITGAWETAGEVLETVLSGSGYHLEVHGWLPGDPVPEWADQPTGPCVLVDLVPYRQRPGLEWSVEAGDIVKWSMTTTRPTATRVTVGYETDTQELRAYQEYRRESGVGRWGRREDYTEYEYQYPAWADKDAAPDPYRVQDGMGAEADKALMEGAATVSLDAEVEVSNLWTFSQDRLAPRTFDVGDLAQVTLPYLGTFTRTITAVEVKITPSEFTVTPTVSTPDTLDRDMFTTLATLDRRVSNLEKGK